VVDNLLITFQPLFKITTQSIIWASPSSI